MPAVIVSVLGSAALSALFAALSIATYWRALGLPHQYGRMFGSFQICQVVIGFLGMFGCSAQYVPFEP